MLHLLIGSLVSSSSLTSENRANDTALLQLFLESYFIDIIENNSNTEVNTAIILDGDQLQALHTLVRKGEFVVEFPKTLLKIIFVNFRKIFLQICQFKAKQIFLHCKIFIFEVTFCPIFTWNGMPCLYKNMGYDNFSWTKWIFNFYWTKCIFPNLIIISFKLIRFLCLYVCEKYCWHSLS